MSAVDGWRVALEVLAGGAAAMVGGLLAALWARYRRCRREAEALRREREVMFGFVHDVAEVFSESDESDAASLLEKVLYYALGTSRAAAGAAHLFDSDGLALRIRAVTGMFPPLQTAVTDPWDSGPSKSASIEHMARSETIRAGEGIVGEVAASGVARLIQDAEREPLVPRHGPALLRIRSLIAVPMRFRRRTMGVITVLNRVDGRPFTPGDLNLLQALADQASVSLHYSLLREELDAKRRLDHDLAVARRIQRALLPSSLPEPAGVEFAAVNVPAEQVGGDYYDVLWIDDRRIGLAIADVSGKGVSGALMMSVFRSALRATAPGCVSPAAVLSALNRVVAPDLGGDMFVTALYMVLDLAERRLTVARAGHDAPILYRPAQRGITRIDAPGIGIGIGDAALFEATLGETSVVLDPGDVLAAFTDGLSEARDDSGAEFGTDRLMETLVTSAAEPAAGILAAVQERIRRFCGGRPPEDDLTVLIARLKTDADGLGRSF